MLIIDEEPSTLSNIDIEAVIAVIIAAFICALILSYLAHSQEKNNPFGGIRFGQLHFVS